MSIGNYSSSADAARVDEQNCRFGRWINSDESLQNFGQIESCAAVAKPHAALHNNMHIALETMESNWEQDSILQEQLFGAFEQVERFSDEVIENLDKMVIEKHGHS